VGLTARLQLWWAKQWRIRQPADSMQQIVRPLVHCGHLVKLHNIATLLFWLACCFALLDSHIPSWPLNRLLTRALTGAGQAQPVMPVWALMSLIYVGAWVLHLASRAVTEALPPTWAKGLLGVARKDSRRAAEGFFPYGG
jgi:hypothetical protein